MGQTNILKISKNSHCVLQSRDNLAILYTKSSNITAKVMLV